MSTELCPPTVTTLPLPSVTGGLSSPGEACPRYQISGHRGLELKPHKDCGLYLKPQTRMCPPALMPKNTSAPAFLYSVDGAKADPSFSGHKGPTTDESCCGTLLHSCPQLSYLMVTQNREPEVGSEHTRQLSGGMPIPPSQGRAGLHCNPEAKYKAVSSASVKT